MYFTYYKRIPDTTLGIIKAISSTRLSELSHFNYFITNCKLVQRLANGKLNPDMVLVDLSTHYPYLFEIGDELIPSLRSFNKIPKVTTDNVELLVQINEAEKMITIKEFVEDISIPRTNFDIYLISKNNMYIVLSSIYIDYSNIDLELGWNVIFTDNFTKKLQLSKDIELIMRGPYRKIFHEFINK